MYTADTAHKQRKENISKLHVLLKIKSVCIGTCISVWTHTHKTLISVRIETGNWSRNWSLCMNVYVYTHICIQMVYMYTNGEHIHIRTHSPLLLWETWYWSLYIYVHILHIFMHTYQHTRILYACKHSYKLSPLILRVLILVTEKYVKTHTQINVKGAYV